MDISKVISAERSIQLTWSNGQSVLLPYVWLRDNDPEDLHPDTLERTFDLTSIELAVRPISYEFNSQALIVQWPQLDRPSVYHAKWLWAYQPGRPRTDSAHVARQFWDGEKLHQVATFDAHAVQQDGQQLRELLKELKKTGIIIISPLTDSDAGDRFGDLIGFKRRSNFGKIFEVINKPQPNNLAYTSLALPLHTDLSSQEIIPGYQFLHCLENDAIGGDSVFADGFKVCEDFRQANPAQFELLSTLEVPWRFHDDTCDISAHRPVIMCDSSGQVDTLVFNAHLADVPDFDADTLIDFYEAYQMLMLAIRRPRYHINYKLKAGEMVVFDNRRILHGRTEFDPNSGKRHLRGFYIERNEVDSRIRVLSRSD